MGARVARFRITSERHSNVPKRHEIVQMRWYVLCGRMKELMGCGTSCCARAPRKEQEWL